MELISAGTYIFGKNKQGVWHILCGKRAGNDPRYQGGLFNVPVGMSDYGEDPLQTAHRECMEETTLDFPTNLFKFVGVDNWAPNKYGANFLIVIPDTIDNWVAKQGDWENETFQWVPVDKIDSLKWAYGMNKTALSIFSQFVNDRLNEGQTRDNVIVWGIPIDRWEYLSYTMSKGTAQDFIEKHGNPNNTNQVKYCLDPNKSIGFCFYSMKLFAKRTGDSTAAVNISDDGWLYSYVGRGKDRKILSVIKYDFTNSLINNLRILFDKTPKGRRN